MNFSKLQQIFKPILKIKKHNFKNKVYISKINKKKFNNNWTQKLFKIIVYLLKQVNKKNK